MVQIAQVSGAQSSFNWEDLLALLRDELQEYGGLVGLLSAQQQSMLQSTATLGQKQTMRQRLKSDLMKQRAGMAIDESTSRLEVRMTPVVASGFATADGP